MKEFDLNTTTVSPLNKKEVKELKEYLATRPFKEVKKFCLRVLDKEYHLGEITPESEKVAKFLDDEQFLPVKNSVMKTIDD